MKWQVVGAEIQGFGGKCLDVRGPSTADGTPVQLWDCNGSPNSYGPYNGPDQHKEATPGQLRHRQSRRLTEAEHRPTLAELDDRP